MVPHHDKGQQIKKLWSTNHMSVHENHLVLLSMRPSRYIVLCIEYSRKVKKKIWIFSVCEVNCQIEIYWYIRGLHHALISPFLPILFNRTVFGPNRPTQCLCGLLSYIPSCHLRRLDKPLVALENRSTSDRN